MRRLLAVLLVTTGFVTVAARPPQPAEAAEPDPRWVFYTDDKTWYTSPWFGGKHRIMIPFGCTEAPYYSPDPRCKDENGFHHGIDIAMACGTKLFAARRATVVDPASLGPAYGTTPLLLRHAKWDLVIGHVRKRYVAPGRRGPPRPADRARLRQRRAGRLPPALREARTGRQPRQRDVPTGAARPHPVVT